MKGLGMQPGGVARTSVPWLDPQAGAWRRLAPYAAPLILALTLPVLFFADSRVASLSQQYLLGLAMFAVLAVATRSSPPGERRLVWLAVLCWSGVEVFASLGWGLYRYRLGNIPLFVPPGHGVVYLCGLRASRTPLFQRHPRRIGAIALGLAALWAVGGLTILPRWTGRLDIAGALLWPILALCVWRSPAGRFYAAIFAVTGMLEVVGTALGCWAWAPVQPITGLPSGNPPSAIAAAYCLVDLILLRIVGHDPATGERRRQRPLMDRTGGQGRGFRPRFSGPADIAASGDLRDHDVIYALYDGNPSV
jgi:hypothetical protein